MTGQVKFELSGDAMRNIKIDQVRGIRYVISQFFFFFFFFFFLVCFVLFFAMFFFFFFFYFSKCVNSIN